MFYDICQFVRRDPIEAPAALASHTPRPKVNFDDSVYDGELANARRRAERAITEDTFFDSKGARVAKNNAAKVFDDIDEEVCLANLLLFPLINYKCGTF